MRMYTYIGWAALTSFALGASQTAHAAWDPGTALSSWESSHMIRVQERTQPRTTFRGRPEFPPPGYLAEFDEPRGQQRESGSQSRGRFQDLQAGPSAGREMERPEYAPGSRSGQYPGARMEFPGGSRPGGTPSQFPERVQETPVRPTWAQPPAPPPRGTMEPARPYGAWPERDELPPSRPRWQAPASPGSGDYEHQWPASPGSGSSFQTQPEFHSGSVPGRSRPGGTPDRFTSPPEFPGPRSDWQR